MLQLATSNKLFVLPCVSIHKANHVCIRKSEQVNKPLVCEIHCNTAQLSFRLWLTFLCEWSCVNCDCTAVLVFICLHKQKLPTLMSLKSWLKAGVENYSMELWYTLPLTTLLCAVYTRNKVKCEKLLTLVLKRKWNKDFLPGCFYLLEIKQKWLEGMPLGNFEFYI